MTPLENWKQSPEWKTSGKLTNWSLRRQVIPIYSAFLANFLREIALPILRITVTLTRTKPTDLQDTQSHTHSYTRPSVYCEELHGTGWNQIKQDEGVADGDVTSNPKISMFKERKVYLTKSALEHKSRLHRRANLRWRPGTHVASPRTAGCATAVVYPDYDDYSVIQESLWSGFCFLAFLSMMTLYSLYCIWM